jgi:segregation and condensation protein B
MARDESTGSLADQAAAWVPPWSRSPEPAEQTEPPDHDGGVHAEPAEDALPEPAAVGAEPREAGPELDEPVQPAAAMEPAEPIAGEPVAGEPAEVLAEPQVVEPPAAEVLADEPGAEEPGAGEPRVVEALAPDEPLELLPPEEPLEPLPPEEPLEPLPPAEPLEPLPPAEPLEPLEPFEPTDPLEPGDPLATSTDGSAASGEAQTPSDQSSQLAAIATTELKGALEAILLVIDEPVSEIMLAQIIEQPTERISATLAELAAEYDEQGRGFELRAVAGGWRFYTRTAYATYVEKFVLDGQQVRLTQAALETLAVIAYKQPVTRSRISAIRGVNCDGVVRTLLSRGLVEECGSEPDSGAHLYRTTTLFLEKLGLNSVDQLPALAPFLPDDVEALADATG